MKMISPITYLSEVRAEFSKVIWPRRSETLRLSLIVIAVSIVVGIFITLLDLGFTKLQGLIVR